MITNLLIENFQKHGSINLNLEAVTTIIGDTDVGKSSLLRALAWLCLNNTRGDGFIKRGEKSVRVSAKVDGKKVSRQRKPGNNTYQLDKQSFQAVASSVPDEVAKFLCLSQENFQRQMEGPFWFSLTPGQVSRELNSIINLEEMDRVLETLASWLRQAQSEKTSTERRVLDAKDKATSLAWVKEAKKEQESISAMEEEVSSLRLQHAKLNALIEEMWECVTLQANAKQMMLDATELKSLASELEQNIEQEAELSNLLQDMETEEDKVCHLTGQVSKLEKQLAKLQKGKCPLCKKTW